MQITLERPVFRHYVEGGFPTGGTGNSIFVHVRCCMICDLVKLPEEQWTGFTGTRYHGTAHEIL